MTSKCIQRIVRWAIDTDLKTFAEDAYGFPSKGTSWDNAYCREKFRLMQSNFIMWIAGLDNRNRKRLIKAINSKDVDGNKKEGNEWEQLKNFTIS
mgnify:CR=1 FL=1